jgi:FemAB-related protein (PEP-CTERM system-associated)
MIQSLTAPPAPLTAPVQVELYGGGSGEWDAFVRTAPNGTFFHLLGWRDVLSEAFGFRPHYLIARRAGCVVGVLPLCEVRSPLRRCRLLSLPFAVRGGVCAVDGAAQRALEEAAVALCNERDAACVELRDGLDGGAFTIRDGLYYGFRRAVFTTDAENLAAMRPKQRRMVRVGQKAGLVARVDSGDVETFYDLFARSMRRLGTPVFALRYFHLLLDRFADHCALLTVWHRQTPVAASLSFLFGDAVLPYYAGSRRGYFRYAINDFMYWELMQYARRRGVRLFDFGRSKRNTGAYEFKRHWGFEPEPLRYRIYAVADRALEYRHPSDAAVQMLRRSWQHLPLALTRLLGPALVRHFGVYYT